MVNETSKGIVEAGIKNGSQVGFQLKQGNPVFSNSIETTGNSVFFFFHSKDTCHREINVPLT